jgi:uncharacterized protein YbjT (DUF2867 family)
MPPMAEAESRVAMLAGASGFVGSLALNALLDASDVTRVIAVTRRQLGREHPRLANRIVQFDRIETQLKGLKCNFALCCLGTTIRQAGSEAAFRQVDVEFVTAFARAAKSADAQRFVVLSAVGADPESKNFYLRTKGEMELALAVLGFQSLDIMQPALLLGWRNSMRPLELLARAAMPLINPFLSGTREPYRGIPARTVAAAMIGVARSNRRGTQRYTYSTIQSFARMKAPRGGASPEPKAQSK